MDKPTPARQTLVSIVAVLTAVLRLFGILTALSLGSITRPARRSHPVHPGWCQREHEVRPELDFEHEAAVLSVGMTLDPWDGTGTRDVPGELTGGLFQVPGHAPYVGLSVLSINEDAGGDAGMAFTLDEAERVGKALLALVRSGRTGQAVPQLATR